MRNGTRAVSIIGLPDAIEKTSNKAISDDLENCINVDRPAVVLDCSALRTVDRRTLHLLLCCLEEAMKRNGDIRLAALSPEARSVLQSAGVDSLFCCFESVNEAVESYRRPQFEFHSRAKTEERQSEMNAA